MKILRAEHLGMCFGVRDAIALALETAQYEPLTVLGDLVHNEIVLAELRGRGIRIRQTPAAAETKTVMITAHGASERKISETRRLGLNVVEATCPLVHLAHHSLKKLVNAGFHPVIIGKRDHVEVRGMTEDLSEFDVLLSETDVENLQERSRFGVISQTTQPIEKARHLVRLLHDRFPNSEIRFVDTVCQPTKQRQSAAVELAQNSSIVIVIGGAHSNNTRELVQTCSRFCGRVHHVQTEAGLRSEWFLDDDVVGITAGTSTPDKLITEVEQRIERISAEALSPKCGASASNHAPVIENQRQAVQSCSRELQPSLTYE